MKNDQLKNQLIEMGFKPKEQYVDKINYGNIDSESDKKLYDYFLDDDYYSKIVHGDTYFVTGRKGTGKTALYRWIDYKKGTEGYFCNNLTLSNMPHSEFLQLKDDRKATNTSYQTIWEYIILCDIARQIVFDPNPDYHANEFRDLERYIKAFYGKDTVDLHQVIVRVTEKRGIELKGPKIGAYWGKQNYNEIDRSNYINLSTVNAKLYELIDIYLMEHNTKKLLIQFDGLDNDYDIENFTQYKSIIISLLNSIYELNNKFVNAANEVKIICYLRNDIYRAIHDYHSNSAKWEMKKLELNWSIKFDVDYKQGLLRKMIELRIIKSFPELKNHEDPFNFVFNYEQELISYSSDNPSLYKDVFKEMIKRTMHRPRDLIAYCNFVKKELKSNRVYDKDCYDKAYDNYTKWLWREISNEVNTVLEPTQLRRFLCTIGNYSLEENEFRDKFHKFNKEDSTIINLKTRNKMQYIEFAEHLFNFGLIVNVKKNHHNIQYFTIIRDDEAVFNRKLGVKINECLTFLNNVF